MAEKQKETLPGPSRHWLRKQPIQTEVRFAMWEASLLLLEDGLTGQWALQRKQSLIYKQWPNLSSLGKKKDDSKKKYHVIIKILLVHKEYVYSKHGFNQNVCAVTLWEHEGMKARELIYQFSINQDWDEQIKKKQW